MEDKAAEKKGSGFVIFREDTLERGEPLILSLVQEDGVFDLPKGRIDPGESPLDAAVRIFRSTRGSRTLRMDS